MIFKEGGNGHDFHYSSRHLRDDFFGRIHEY